MSVNSVCAANLDLNLHRDGLLLYLHVNDASRLSSPWVVFDLDGAGWNQTCSVLVQHLVSQKNMENEHLAGQTLGFRVMILYCTVVGAIDEFMHR